MKVIRVATDDSGAYYSIVSRLKEAGLWFVSVSPSDVVGLSWEPVITTRKELHAVGGVALAIEDLSETPLVMKGQILSRFLEESKKVLLIGIDPGSRIGVAVFYGGQELGVLTTNSTETLVGILDEASRNIRHSTLMVKIGNGEPRSAARIANRIREVLPSARVEIVDESGTSLGRRRASRATRDQQAAVRIAFRKAPSLTASPLRRTRG
jgi:hypothetical protein